MFQLCLYYTNTIAMHLTAGALVLIVIINWLLQTFGPRNILSTIIHIEVADRLKCLNNDTRG